METENKKNTVELTQITFKCTEDDYQRIEKSAGELGVNRSEYCRIKCLITEDEAFKLKTKALEQEKTIKTLRVKLSFYNETARDPNNIVLQLTSKQNELFQKLFCDWADSDEPLGWNLVCFILEVLKGENWFNEKNIFDSDIQDAFCPEEEEQE